MKFWSLGACAALVGTLFGVQRPFREFPGVEYRLGEIPLPPDYKRSRRMRIRAPDPIAGGRRFGGGGGMGAGFGRGYGGGMDWEHGNSIRTQDFPRADRHFSQAVRRLTRLTNLSSGARFPAQDAPERDRLPLA